MPGEVVFLAVAFVVTVEIAGLAGLVERSELGWQLGAIVRILQHTSAI